MMDEDVDNNNSTYPLMDDDDNNIDRMVDNTLIVEEDNMECLLSNLQIEISVIDIQYSI